MKAICNVGAAVALWTFVPSAHAAQLPRVIYYYLSVGKRWCGYPSLAELNKHVAKAGQDEVDDGGIFVEGASVAKIEESFTNVEAEVFLLARYVVRPDGAVVTATASLKDDEGEHIWRYDVARSGYAPARKPKGFKEPFPEEFRRPTRVADLPFSGLAAAFTKAPNSREICL